MKRGGGSGKDLASYFENSWSRGNQDGKKKDFGSSGNSIFGSSAGYSTRGSGGGNAGDKKKKSRDFWDDWGQQDEDDDGWQAPRKEKGGSGNKKVRKSVDDLFGEGKEW
jgi:hypothetical protein